MMFTLRKVMSIFVICAVSAILFGCGEPYVIEETEEARQKRLEKFHAIIPRDALPVVAVDGKIGEVKLSWAEGPSWVNGRLIFSNSFQDGFHVLNPDGSHSVYCKDMKFCGTTPLKNGNLAVCDIKDSRILEMTQKGEVVKVLADSQSGLPPGNPNDLVTDSKGGLYISVNEWSGKIENSNVIVYLNSKGELSEVTEPGDFNFPNGCLLSADGSKLFIGSNDPVIYVFDVNEDGTLSNKRPFATLIMLKAELRRKQPRSHSDGMEIDRYGNLFVASSVGVQVFDKTGEFLGIIHFPKFPSNLAFGGDDLSILYVTCRDRIYSLQTKTQGYQYPIK